MKILTTIVIFSSMVVTGCATQNWQMHRCDSSKPETAQAGHFETNSADGTVFDTRTRLTWKICAAGQSYSEGRCRGKASLYSWDNAVYAFAGRGDGWRLPDIDELNSIAEKGCRDPAVDMTIFPDAPASGFWSATSYAAETAMYVDFANSSSAAVYKKNNNHVRLVRGREWFSPSKVEERKRLEMTERRKDEAELSADRQRRKAELQLVHDEKDDYVTCYDDSSCDKMFTLTREYIRARSTRKIQLATDSTIETSSPEQDGDIAMSARKIPAIGSSSDIYLTVSCRVDDKGIYDKLCERRQLEIYRGFRPFINKMFDK